MSSNLFSPVMSTREDPWEDPTYVHRKISSWRCRYCRTSFRCISMGGVHSIWFQTRQPNSCLFRIWVAQLKKCFSRSQPSEHGYMIRYLLCTCNEVWTMQLKLVHMTTENTNTSSKKTPPPRWNVHRIFDKEACILSESSPNHTILEQNEFCIQEGEHQDIISQ